MSGYANRLITLKFEELTEPGQPVIHVVMRNPRLVPPGELVRKSLPVDATGEPDVQQAMQTSYELIAKLIVGWLAFDAASADEEQPRLGLPATPAEVAKLPVEIINAISAELSKVNPQTRTASPEEPTSRT